MVSLGDLASSPGVLPAHPVKTKPKTPVSMTILQRGILCTSYAFAEARGRYSRKFRPRSCIAPSRPLRTSPVVCSRRFGVLGPGGIYP